jgi:epoxyqueuosine reductase QueG
VGPNATAIVGGALAGTGLDRVASCDAAVFDAWAPRRFRSASWLPGARGLVVVGSAGPTLWRRFRAHMNADPEAGDASGARARWDEPDPLDRFVAGLLARADAELAAAGVRFCRFEAAVHATPRVDFVALGRLVGLGSPGPFGMLIHAADGPWWALRGAWLVDADVDAPLDHAPPCVGCPAPCVGGWENAGDVATASPEVRGRCVVGRASRYDDDQIAYHHDRAATVARLKRG